ncbi:DUF1433 domain-containing protein [Lentibacillus sp. N15]|uniref:DUF1433 domain-containing protein n=1 Tax=Lentibacillus songyuanensis TaxID=3136161 RepID=UPI0031BABF1F
MNKDEVEYDDKTIKKAQEKVESFIRNNYRNVETVEFEPVKPHPMGGIAILGTVNNSAGFTADIDMDTFRVMSLGEKMGFPEVKEECEDEVCDY